MQEGKGDGLQTVAVYFLESVIVRVLRGVLLTNLLKAIDFHRECQEKKKVSEGFSPGVNGAKWDRIGPSPRHRVRTGITEMNIPRRPTGITTWYVPIAKVP